MKKIEYQAPEMEEIKMNALYLLSASDGNSGTGSLDDEYSDDNPK